MFAPDLESGVVVAVLVDVVGHREHPLVADEHSGADEHVGVPQDGGHPRVRSEVGLGRFEGVARDGDDLPLTTLAVLGGRTAPDQLPGGAARVSAARARRTAQLLVLAGTLQLVIYHRLRGR